MSVEFIYFDLGKVIFDFDHGIACRRLAQCSGASEMQVDQAIFGSGLEDQFETGLVGEGEFCQRIRDAIGGDLTDAKILEATSDIFRPNQPIFPLIGQLAAVSFPTGILSNTCSSHWNWLAARFRVLHECFGKHALSFQAKSMKPDAGVYRHAIELSGREPSAIFFVDDKQENVDGALACGIDAVLYRSVPELLAELDQRGVRINL